MFRARIHLDGFDVLGRVERRDVVLGRVDQAGLEPGVDLGGRRVIGIGAHGADQRHPQVGLLDTDFQALGIGDGLDRLLGVDRARAAVVEGQADKASTLAALEDLIAGRAIQGLAHVLDRAEEEGHGGHHGERAHTVHRAHVDAREIQGADLHLVDGFLFLTKRCLVEHLDLVLATAHLLQHLAHVLAGDDGGIVVGIVRVGPPALGGLGAQRQRGGKRDECRFQLHGGLLWFE